MDLQTKKLFEKLDKLYYENKEIIKADYKEEKLNFYKITKEVMRIRRKIQTLLKEENEEVKLGHSFYMSLHKELFKEIYPKIAGKTRNINLIKREDLLNGKSIKYASTLELKMEGESFLDMFEEKILNSSLKNQKEILLKNTVKLWEKHYFYEGNTRTTALYLDIFSLKHNLNLNFMNKDLKEFRNALVLAVGKNDWEKLYSFF